MIVVVGVVVFFQKCRAFLKIIDRTAHHRAEPGVHRRFCHGLRKVVHIKTGGNAALQILQKRQPGQVINIFCGQLGFQRKDFVIQPAFQGQIVAKGATKCHGRVGVGILKGRHQQIAVQVDLPVRFCPRVRPQAHNTVAVYPYLLVRNIHLVLLQ